MIITKTKPISPFIIFSCKHIVVVQYSCLRPLIVKFKQRILTKKSIATVKKITHHARKK